MKDNFSPEAKLNSEPNSPVTAHLSLFVAFLITMLSLFYRLPYWLNHPLLIHADQSVYLAMAELLLQGKIAYVDFFDFNPPLIIYLNTLPALVSHLVNVPPATGFNFSVYVLLILSTALTAALFFFNRHSSERFLYFPLLLAPIICTQTQSYDFGQREHLFVLLYFPFLVTRILRYRSALLPLPLAIGAAILAAAGLSLKPQFLITAVLVECALAVQYKTRRHFSAIESKICLSLVALYLLHLILLSENARSVFLNQAWPIYSQGLSFFQIGFIESLASNGSYSYPYYLMTIALSLAFALKEKSSWFLPLVTFTLVSLLSYLQAGNIWTYRGLPLQAGSIMLICLATGVILQGLWQHCSDKFRIAFLIVCCLASCLVYGLLSPREPRGARFDLAQIGYGGTSPLADLSPTFTAIIANSKVDDRVIYIGAGVRPGYPAILQGRRRPGSRYLHGMILPMLGKCIEADRARFEPLLDQVIANYGQDISKNKPRLIFIEHFYVAPLLAKRNFVVNYMSDYVMVAHADQAYCTLYRRK